MRCIYLSLDFLDLAIEAKSYGCTEFPFTWVGSDHRTVCVGASCSQ
jgi:hypothetical protein